MKEESQGKGKEERWEMIGEKKKVRERKRRVVK